MREECPGHWPGHFDVYIFKEKWKKEQMTLTLRRKIIK